MGLRDMFRRENPEEGDQIDLNKLSPEITARMAKANKHAEELETGGGTPTTKRAVRRLAQADATFARKVKPGKSTYTKETLASVSDALSLGMLDSHSSGLLSQMNREINNRQLKLTDLPRDIRAYIEHERNPGGRFDPNR